jgi:iron complex transport system substrate-binding protein
LNIGAPLTFEEDVEKLGIILGKDDEADEYINWSQSYLDVIAERVEGLSEEEKPRVFDYYGGEWGMDSGPPYGTYGEENFWVGPLIERAGGINIAGDLPGDWITVDPEWVITQNPSIIIREAFAMGSDPIVGYDTDDTSEVTAIRKEIMSQPEFEISDAVQADNVYVVSGGLIQADWFIGLPYMATWFHPELFADLDPQAIHQEYLTRFMRLDYDLDEHGVFVYAEP